MRPFIFDEVKIFATVSSTDGVATYVEVPLTAEHQATKQFATDPSNPEHSALILQPGQSINWTVYAQVKAGDGPFVAELTDHIRDCAGEDGLPDAGPGEPACTSNYKQFFYSDQNPECIFDRRSPDYDQLCYDDAGLLEEHVIDDFKGVDRTLSANSGQTDGADIATTADKVCFAQSFTVGEDTDGGTDGFRLTSVEIGANAGPLQMPAVPALQALDETSEFPAAAAVPAVPAVPGVIASVTIRPDADGVPHGSQFNHLHAKLINPTLDQDTGTLETFVATDTTPDAFGTLVSPGFVRLEAGATYWVSVCNLGDVFDPGLSVATTASDGHDLSGFGDWTIGDNVYVYNSAATPPGWAALSDTAFGTDAVERNMKIKLNGWSNTRTDGKAPGVTASDGSQVTHRGTQSGSAHYRE